MFDVTEGACAAKADLALSCFTSTGVTPQGDPRCLIARTEGNLGQRSGYQAIRGCARGSQGLQKSAATPGEASRKRVTRGTPAMEGTLDR